MKAISYSSIDLYQKVLFVPADGDAASFLSVASFPEAWEGKKWR